VASSVPKIYATMENMQEEYQASIVDPKGIIIKQPISILIDLIYNLSYFSPQLVESCSLQRKKQTKAWLVQLAIGTKRKVARVIEDFQFEMSGLHTQATLNILPLGSYDVFLGMDWLVNNKEKLNFYENNLEFEDQKENARVLQGIQNPISVKQISALQLNKFSIKECPLDSIQVLNSVEINNLKDEDHPALWEFKDMFPEEVLGLPPVTGKSPCGQVNFLLDTRLLRTRQKEC
jgi:hypothetical protein